MDDAEKRAREISKAIRNKSFVMLANSASVEEVERHEQDAIAAALRDAEAPLREEIESLQADAANDHALIECMRESERQVYAAIGIERGRDGWPEFMSRLRAHVAGIEACGIGKAAQWHMDRRPRLSGPDYGMASDEQRRAMRQADQFHLESAKAIRALAAQPAPQRDDAAADAIESGEHAQEPRDDR